MSVSYYFEKMRYDPETKTERRALMIRVKRGRGGSVAKFVRWLDEAGATSGRIDSAAGRA